MKIDVLFGTHHHIVCGDLPLVIVNEHLEKFAEQASDFYRLIDDVKMYVHDDLTITATYDDTEHKLDPGVRMNAEKLLRFMRLLKLSGIPVEVGARSVYRLARQLPCNTANYRRWVRQMGSTHRITQLEHSFVTTAKDGLFGVRTIALPITKNATWVAFHGMNIRSIYAECGCNLSTFADAMTRIKYLTESIRFSEPHWVNIPRAIIHPVIRDAFAEYYGIGNDGLPANFDDYANSLLVITALNCDGKISPDDEYDHSYTFWQALRTIA
ncbi:MAG: hypothetical protein K2F99_08765, partial [Muribaculaceae bacterium]|nr:hypothetical protein [Muribaculaceae bacterium]